MRRPIIALLTLLLLLEGPFLSAQLPADRLLLEDVVTRTLESSPDIAMARAERDANSGALRAAGDPFDTRLRSFVTRAQDNSVSPLPTGPSATAPVTTGTIQSAISAARTFRSGMSVSSQWSLARTDLSTLSDLINQPPA